MRDLNEKKLEDCVRDYTFRFKKLEEELKALYFERDKLTGLEKTLKERCQDLELRLSKEQRLNEEKVSQIEKNSEQDIKRLKNDLELKEF